ncbi:hypothetical protein BgAZ_400810 [Babesia gibsoni]|uniref:RAP domain-containing protein n=1 Tax=Babesia gibsoni TaxID=33632 RepID=A0AAD8PDF1_BABGI|nr:hypothetical protein BgAZ_400810 [Babesia gibsoni]
MVKVGFLNFLQKMASGRELSLSNLSVVERICVLRVLESSGVLWKPLEACLIEEARFSQLCFWELLSSLGCFANERDISHIRSKHLVGLVWHLVKVANCLHSSINLDIVDPLFIKNSEQSYDSLLIKSADETRSWHASKILLYHKTLMLVTQLLIRLKNEKIDMNGKDIQQILMLSREKVFLSMPNPQEELIPRRGTQSDLEHDLLVARREALKCIEELATSYANVLSDAELASVFVSCCTKDISDGLMKTLGADLGERSNKGYLNITIRDCINLLNSSKIELLPKSIIKSLMAQLESCPFKGSLDTQKGISDEKKNSHAGTLSENDACLTNDMEGWKRSFQNATVIDVGRLCRSLYHLNCSKKLLSNLDQKLNSLLISFSFSNRLKTRERPESSLNAGVMTIASMVHLFARNGFTEWQSLDNMVNTISTIPWNDNIDDEMTILGDLCWSLLTLKVDVELLSEHLSRFITKLEYIPLKQTVKLLGGFYNYLGDECIPRLDSERRFASGRETMDEMLAYTLQSSMEPPGFETDQTVKKNFMKNITREKDNKKVNQYIQGLKCQFMKRMQDIDDAQTISNFMFYIVSTLDNLTTEEYNILCSRWLDISKAPSFSVKVEALSQALWSVQKNRIYHERFLIRVRQLLSDRLRYCSMGQLALVSHTMSSYNFLDETFIKSMFNRIDHLAREKDSDYRPLNQRPRHESWDIKLLSVIWSVILSDFTNMDVEIIKKLIGLLRYVDWDIVMETGKHQDFRKILQINNSICIELPKSYSYIDDENAHTLIPDHVICAAKQASQTHSNSSILSVSQDKTRRSLSSLGVNYKGEHEVYCGLTVDFAIARDSEEFKPDLVIEMDGPHHYNVVCDECTVPFSQVGPLRLIPNGKTLYRNRWV